VSRITFCLSCLCRFTPHLLYPRWGPDPPLWGQGCPSSMFFMLMVDAPRSPALSPPRGPPSTFLSVDGGRSQISSSGTSQGGAVDVFYVDGGRSRISISTSHGARHRRFLALMVDAPESQTPPPPKGAAVDMFYVDGRHSQISISTSQGARHRCFLALMMGAPKSPAPTSPRRPTVNVS
jgi:hypothetical protein